MDFNKKSAGKDNSSDFNSIKPRSTKLKHKKKQKQTRHATSISLKLSRR